jgi:hypothetical protein
LASALCAGTGHLGNRTLESINSDSMLIGLGGNDVNLCDIRNIDFSSLSKRYERLVTTVRPRNPFRPSTRNPPDRTGRVGVCCMSSTSESPLGRRFRPSARTKQLFRDKSCKSVARATRTPGDRLASNRLKIGCTQSFSANAITMWHRTTMFMHVRVTI